MIIISKGTQRADQLPGACAGSAGFACWPNLPQARKNMLDPELARVFFVTALTLQTKTILFF